MNKRKLMFYLAVGFLSIPFVVHADSNTTSTQPGSVDDPVITKSYFDQNIKQKVTDELSKQSLTEDKVKQLIADALGTQKPNTSPVNTGSTSGSGVNTNQPAVAPSNLTVIKLEQGQTLTMDKAQSLLCEPAKFKFLADDNGVADVTSGKDIGAGQTADLNHLLIVPRVGLGLKPIAKQKDDTYIMIRGIYLLTNAGGSKVIP